MQSYLKVISTLLRLRPLALGVLAFCVLGVGVALQLQENRTNLDKADALLAGPPAAVPVAAMLAAATGHPFKEVTVQAQLDLDMAYEMVLASDGAERSGYMVPLLDASAKSVGGTAPDVLAMLLYDADDLAPGDLDTLLLGPVPEAEGPYGPIVMLNGMVGEPGDFEDSVREIFALENRALPADFPVLREFQGDRAAAYGPDWTLPFTIFGFFAWIAGIIGIWAVIRSAFRAKPAAAPPEDALPQSI